MVQVRHRSAILFSGISWFLIGIFLLYKGVQYLIESGNQFFTGTHQGFTLIGFINSFGGKPEEAALILVCLALFIGIIKGRLAMRKTVNRIVSRIRNLPSPFSLKQLYTRGYYILLGSMMLLGVLFKFLPFPLDVKGFLDFTIGVALINGGMLYFREAYAS